MAKPKGKYAEVIGKLPKTFGNDEKHQEVVQKLKDSLQEQFGASFTTSRLAMKYAALRKEKDDLEMQEKQLNLYIEAYSQLLAEAYEAEGVTSQTFDGVGAIRLQYEPYPTVKDSDAVRAWAMENGLERKLSLPWKTLEAVVKQRLLDGEPDVPGVKTFNKTKMVYTKA